MEESLRRGKEDRGSFNQHQHEDPWDLPPYSLQRKNKSNSLRTHSGYWKEKEEELTAIRSSGESSSSSTAASPSYVGVRKTLEFYLKDGTRAGEGTKTDWIIHEYYDLRKDDAGAALFLQEDVVLRKVFRKCKTNKTHSDILYRQVESCVEAYKELKQVHGSHRGDNYGNKPGIILGMEEAQCQYRSSSLVRPYYIAGQLPGFPFLGTPIPKGVVRANFYTRSPSSAKEEPTPPEASLLRSLPKDSLELVLSRVQYIAQSLQNRMIHHTIKSVISSLLTSIEQKVKCCITSGSEPNEELGVDCDPNALHNLLTTIEKKIKSCVHSHSVSAPNEEDLGVGCDPPDGKSDHVWKHFTKIRSSNDPDEVYAACHRCDKVLKGHPKKHGTSHLKRHIHTCSSCTNPSTDEDRAMLDHLRTALVDPSCEQEQQKMDSQENLTQIQMDPWDLNLTQRIYFTRKSLNRQTQGGHWKEINKEFTAIRMDQKVCWKDVIDKEIAVFQRDHQLQEQAPQPPQYMGLRRTLHFHRQDGRMMDWIMHEYQQLDGMESPTLLLQGRMVIRKVFRYDKDAAASAFTDLDRLLNADDGDEEYFNGDGVNTDIITTPSDCMDSPCSVFPFGEGVSSDTTTPSCDSMDTPVDRKRKRRTGAPSGQKSQVWMHFTKIYSRDYGVVYVVCHTCDRGYGSGRSTNGTSHLWRHNKSCTNRHSRTGNANDATAAEWEAEIWPLFLLLKNYGEHQPSGAMC